MENGPTTRQTTDEKGRITVREVIARILLGCAGLAVLTWLFYYLFCGILPQIVPWFSAHGYLLKGFAGLVVVLSLVLLVMKLVEKKK